MAACAPGDRRWRGAARRVEAAIPPSSGSAEGGGVVAGPSLSLRIRGRREANGRRRGVETVAAQEGRGAALARGEGVAAAPRVCRSSSRDLAKGRGERPWLTGVLAARDGSEAAVVLGMILFAFLLELIR